MGAPKVVEPILTGNASYYTNESVDPRWGGVTKSGEKFDENELTVAVPPSMWSKLKGRKVRVYNRETGANVVARVNDTGGFEKYDRVADLSKSAFQAIASPSKGVVGVDIFLED